MIVQQQSIQRALQKIKYFMISMLFFCVSVCCEVNIIIDCPLGVSYNKLVLKKKKKKKTKKKKKKKRKKNVIRIVLLTLTLTCNRFLNIAGCNFLLPQKFEQLYTFIAGFNIMQKYVQIIYFIQYYNRFLIVISINVITLVPIQNRKLKARQNERKKYMYKICTCKFLCSCEEIFYQVVCTQIQQLLFNYGVK
eukprot:TRINITY_DN1644_c0_g1_i10.p5 TRINITY_DN1644_c0_g1~~TRINITY_DN1644_c0_g1_i10.p5  ORF type:complete len:193 (-),score=-5.07 TRINITY_DN1644_c0_g1_i10:925-1503(-)